MRRLSGGRRDGAEKDFLGAFAWFYLGIIIIFFTFDTFCIKFDIMNTVAINVRVDKETKDEASQILEGLGLSLSNAINMFLKQITFRDGLPFAVEYPKPKTELEEAIEEAKQLENDPNSKTYETPQELWDEIGV